MEDIYDVQKRLESVRQKISGSSMIESNKGKILEFANCCLANGVGKNKTSRYLYDLHNLSIWLNKPFEEATKKDMEAIMVRLQETKYSEWTKKGYKIIVKKFYKWLRNSKEYPEEVEWIRSNIKENHKKLPEEMLNEEEVMKMIENAVCLRDKAMISVLYDCGCRIGELLTLKIKDVEEAEYGAKVSLSGKTGMRKVLLIFSAPYLLEWINNHPDKELHSYVWVKNNRQRIGYARVRNLLKDTAERAQIKKKVNPHNFRHSRATYYASRLREREMMEYFGWRKSDTVGIYVHLNGEAVDNAILRSQGIIKEKDKFGTLLKTKKCARCKKINKPTDKFCSMCSMSLDEEIANEIKKKDIERQQADEIMQKLMQDKEVLELIKNKLSGIKNYAD